MADRLPYRLLPSQIDELIDELTSDERAAWDVVGTDPQAPDQSPLTLSELRAWRYILDDAQTQVRADSPHWFNGLLAVGYVAAAIAMSYGVIFRPIELDILCNIALGCAAVRAGVNESMVLFISRVRERDTKLQAIEAAQEAVLAVLRHRRDSAAH